MVEAQRFISRYRQEVRGGELHWSLPRRGKLRHTKERGEFKSVMTAATVPISPWLLSEQQAPPPDPVTSLAKKLGVSTGQRVVALLVEDNRGDVMIVEEAILLYNLPIELHVVEDGEKAFEFIRRAEVDPKSLFPQMLILDLNLPKRSGKEVLQRLRQSPTFQRIPVLVITSSESKKDRREVTQLGANVVFHKPSSYDKFLKIGEVLKELLKQHGPPNAAGKS